MTNEDKAEEIAVKNAKSYIVSKNNSHLNNILFTESSIIECEKTALEMAEWKDKQFNEFISSMGVVVKEIYEQYKTKRHHIIDNKRDFYLQQHPEIIKELSELASKLSYSFIGEVIFNTPVGKVTFNFN